MISEARALRVLARLDSPWRIQEYLNSLPYDHVDGCVSPLNVVREGKAQCLEGALLAAACLMMAGRRPLIVDLRAYRDDDHVIAVFREGGLWGAVSKSSFITLEYREPAYRSIRELAMSYFDFYIDGRARISLREYSRPMDLRRFGDGWVSSEKDLEYIGGLLDETAHYRLVKKGAKLKKKDGALLERTWTARPAKD
ncbi:MAG: hypothetical protein V1875_09600 [Candidatus Altiarchaeota archaeon]